MTLESLPTCASSASSRLTRSADSIALIGALAIAHAPLMVNNGFFGDDWLLFEVKPGYPVQTAFLLHGAGHPFVYAYCSVANWLGDPAFFMKALALAAIGIGAAALKSFLCRLGVFSRFEAIVFAFLVWSYAGYQDWATKLAATYLFSFALLCLGLDLFTVIASSGRSRIWLRLCALAVIFCSFSLNSLIAAYYVGISAFFFAEWLERQGCQKIATHLLASIKRFADFLVLPFVYWFSVNHFFPKVGPYKNYYLLRAPGIEDLLSGLYNFWNWGFVQPERIAVNLARESRLPIILALLVGFGFVTLAALLNKRRMDRVTGSAGSAAWPAAAAVILFVACASPYIASGLSPDGHFFESRHLILFGLPLGLILVCTYRTVSLIFHNRAAGQALIALALSANLCALWSGYFFQQARWLRQEALIEGLRLSYSEPPATVFNLVDGFLDHPGHIYFGITEITGALHAAWDSRPLFGFTGRNERPTILQEMDKSKHMDGSAFQNLDLWGPQATIQLNPKPPVLTNYGLSRSYYRCLIRWCDERSIVDTLANTTIRVGPIPNLAPHQS